MRVGLIAAGLLVIALAAFNPGMDDFTTFVAGKSEVLLHRELGDTRLGRALSGAGAAMIGGIIEDVTQRDNYFIFSTYTIDLAGVGGILGDLDPSDRRGAVDDRDAEQWRFLGIAGRFVEMNRPESLRR